MPEPTKFLESNALLHVQEGDEEAARASLKQMLPGELDRLSTAASRLAWLAHYELRLKEDEG